MTENLINARDGTQIFVDDRGPRSTDTVPLLCLPGLTRNSKDFIPVWHMLGSTRRVISLDLRGRGRSQFADPKTYTVTQELDDVITVLDVFNIDRVALIGTSRGGLIGQVMASLHPDRLAGLLLNDIGPEINPVGLKRIIKTIGVKTAFHDWDDAAAKLAAAAVGFTGVSHPMWVIIAQRIFTEHDGHPCTDYDPQLNAFGLSVADVNAGKLKNLWDLTPALVDIPVAILRGEGSDILDAETVKKLHTILPLLLSKTIPGRGHVPFLDEVESTSTIVTWLEMVDKHEKRRPKKGMLDRLQK